MNRKFAKIILICLAIGFFLSFMTDSHNFARWEKLTTPSKMDIAALKGKKATGFYGKIEKCDYSAVQFSLISNHPVDIQDCAQATRYYADGAGFFTYVRTKDGSIWNWSKMTTDYDICPGIWPVLGLITGLSICTNMKRKNNSKENCVV